MKFRVNWKHFPWRSLKTRVTLFTLAIFLASIWSLAFYASRMLRAEMQRLLGDLIGGFNRLLRSLGQREAALRASEERLRTLIDWSIEAIAVHRDGKLIYVNPSAIKMIGAKSAQDLIGKPILDWVPPDYREIALERIKSITDTGIATPLIQEKFLKLDGTVIDVEVQSTSIVYDGKPAIHVAMRDITAQKRVEDALRQREERYRVLAEAAHDIIVLINDRHEVEYANTFAARLFRCLPQQLIGKRLLDIFPPEIAARQIANLQKVLASGESLYVEAPSAFPGSSLWLGSWLVPIKDPCREITAILVVSRDITEHKRAERALAESEARFRSLTRLSSDFYWETDVAHRLVQRAESNSAARESVFHQGSPVGRRRWEVPYVSPDESGWQAHRALLDAHLPFREFVFSRLAADGTERHVSISGDPVFDEAGNFEGYRGVGTDITGRKRLEEQVRQMAFHDTLTNLPNRRLLNDRLSQAMAANRRSGCYGAVMFLDLDDFKLLNDRHGHEAGDWLLIEAADRLKSCVREIDTVARFGGDEFVVMIRELDAHKSESRAQAGIVAEKVRAALAKPYVLKVRREGEAQTTVEHRCTVSIGVALFSKHEASQDDIIKRADTAMYQAKTSGNNLIRFYE